MKNDHLSEMLLKARKAQGLTQQGVSDLSGVGLTVIYKLESGRRDVTFDSFLAVTRALGVRVSCRSPLGDEVDFNG